MRSDKPKCFGNELWTACLSCTVGSECQEEYKKIQRRKENGRNKKEEAEMQTRRSGR
ncbi:hypothetical protein LCGC14_1901870 [marine sediment metagenome]|uniref:Uncharacterized protein n=1 Tax=marine sediment metagenome TaxID=412755 RepID=A0A0F9GJN8_9ZZZZ